MDAHNRSIPRLRGKHWCWSSPAPATQILFVGKGPSVSRGEALRAVAPNRAETLAWMDQKHSSTVLPARRGCSGTADALVTAERDLTLSIATADCLPIVVTGGDKLATIHAGWRGLVAGVIGASLDTLAERSSNMRCWIGPAIGVCCYEVGPEVADRVTELGDSDALVPGPRDRLHLDLKLAAQRQLTRLGISSVHTVDVCTRCSPDWLWSYRLDGVDAGRNWTFAWREESSS